MRFELRPLSFGEVLDGAFKIFRGNLRLFLTIALIFGVPDALITVATRILQGEFPHGKMPLALSIAWFVPTSLLGTLRDGAITAAAVQVITGDPTSVGRALRRFRRVLGPAIVAMFVSSLISALGLVALVVPGVIYALRRWLYLPVLLVEGGTGLQALERSRQLVSGVKEGRTDRMFGATFVFGALGWALTFGLGLLIPAGLSATTVGGVLTRVPQTILETLLPISLVLIYFDARIRDEGYDLELRAREAGATDAIARP